ncbi:helix-turn-helix domain-containing protein [Vibrio agarivorans]|uniref:helix-turn-helix domain-containing protein n=1 Tax=Vibrio agarivorans TaxID=153622 RepID=UPI0022316BD6|nr:transcriptional regulator [Vibrio agarivorans]
MDIDSLRALAIQVRTQMPWLTGIDSEQQYDELIDVMDELVSDHEANSALIDLLFPVIELYEATSEQFKEFNERIDKLDPGQAMLRVLIDQHGLKLSDLPEIGGKSLVSLILKGERKLTIAHIQALSKRFGIPKSMFI